MPASTSSAQPIAENPVPPRDCPLCPRLAAFRAENRAKFPDKFNAPVPPFGPDRARLWIAGLAPGLKGANFSGRPFTGDYAGDLLYATLLKFGFAEGTYRADPNDGLRLVDCRITNAVKCVPPQNKPLPAEIKTCRRFFLAELDRDRELSAILALGQIAHQTIVAAFGGRQAAYKFAHGARHTLPSGLTLFDSYHCSRYNTNTGRLSEAMFHDVFAAIRGHLDGAAPAGV